jgi:predicted nuclease with TOPRIM domain
MGKLITDTNITLDNMLNEEQAQTMRLQATLDSVNRRLLQTYNAEVALEHSINNLYDMVETLQKRFNALLLVVGTAEEILDDIIKNQLSETTIENQPNI